MSKIELYHTGFEIIPEPDIRVGRKNADFGQGFYLSGDAEFSRRWAKERRDRKTYINRYALDTDGLRVKRLSRDSEWFGYIFDNRAWRPDSLADYDVIIGPIANDTIYDTWGIITSGLITGEQALRLLSAGPSYEQTVIKTERGLGALSFLGAEELHPEELAGDRAAVRLEERAYQQELLALLGPAADILQ